MSNPAPIIPMPAPPTDGEPLVVKRKPGRPKKLRPRPTASQAAYEVAIAEARQDALDRDSLLGLLQSDHPDAVAVLRAVTVATAEEQASLRWERERVEERNGDAQRISSRRIEALSKIAALVLESKKLGVGHADPGGAQFRKVEKAWMSMISEAASDTLPADVAQVVLGKLEVAMQSFRDKIDTAG